MRETAHSISPLLMGMALLMLGNGALPTLMAVRLSAGGEPTWLIGLVMAQYYLGIILGTLYGYKLIMTVGHIRTFAALGSTMSAVTLAHAFISDPWAWAIFRFIVGACAVGMYMCVESWLNARADNNSRGQVFSLYVITIYLFQGIGQFLIQLPDETGFALYAVVSVLMSLSIVPVAVTRAPAPVLPQATRFDFVRLWRISPTGMIVSLFSGLILGAFYGVGPVYAQLSGFDRADTALFMSAVIMGGLILQWPMGRFSDGRDRRAFMLIVNLILCAVCLIFIFSGIDGYGLIGMSIIFGGLIGTLYPLSVAYTNDFLEPEDLVPAAGGLVMAYGFGALAGPPAAAFCMEIIGTQGLFLFCAGVALTAAGLITWRIRQRQAPPLEDQVDFQVMPRTSPIIGELDPRAEPVDQQ
jgi:MFS family permease